ncbi:MAG: Tm-1-like ATP-binding domain-containing protein [Planctomycetes bacterium]|nr:Tm-1-like ATP-binding domain-containing protein [Planctomycetota bacterium]
MPTILLIATLDTKGPEIAYVRDRIARPGIATLILDSGILGEPIGVAADVTREQVARAAGSDIQQIRNAGSRGAAVEIMMRGVAAECARLYAEGRCDGIISLGGAEGAVLAAAGMQTLPIGVPKIIVSPLASGRRIFGPFVGIRDVVVMHSVIDILGINSVSRLIFDQAAGAIVGMVGAMQNRNNNEKPTPVKKVVAITMLGNTTKGVEMLKRALEPRGFEVLVFHSNGVGGRAMEVLVDEGRIGSVIDFTTDELTDHLVGGFHDAGPSRLEAAGARGIPQVVVPGCVDFFVQGPRDSVPEKWRGRRTYYQNPSFTLVRTSADEMVSIAATMARKLNAAKGPVAVAVPTAGLSIPNKPDGEFWDVECDRRFRETLASQLRPDIPFAEVDAHVNDRAFADAVLKLFFDIIQ